MTTVTHSGFKIKSVQDGTLYKARIERSDAAEFRADGKIAKAWETSQFMDGKTAVGQAIYAIDSGRIK